VIGAWRAALSAAAERTHTSYAHPQGLLELRESICRFLAMWRGVIASPQDVVIVSGAQQALSLVARIVLDDGATAAIEDPHYQLALHALRAHGARVVGVRTDVEGLVVDEVPANARLVHVTPSHQFPSGTTMSLSRRRRLLDFAAVNSSWILEDDYDGELSYAAKPVPALRSLDKRDRVIYVGSFSKRCFLPCAWATSSARRACVATSCARRRSTTWAARPSSRPPCTRCSNAARWIAT